MGIFLLQYIYKINILLNTCLSYSYNHLLIELVLKQFISWDHSSFHHLNILTTYARKFRMLHSFFKSTFYLLTSGRDLQYVIETPYSPHLYNQCISFERKPTHTHTNTHICLFELIWTLTTTENHLTPTFSGLVGAGWIHLSSCCCPLLSLLVLTLRFLGKTTRVCIFIYVTLTTILPI